MPSHSTFETHNLARLEALLLAHPIARNYFQGILYDHHGHPLTELVIDSGTEHPLRLNAKSLSHLCMIPDGSLVSANRVSERYGSPGGIDIRYSSVFLVEDEENSIIVYSSKDGPAIWLDALYVQSIMLASHAPRRLTTVAFGLMAIAAYRMGFQVISLFGAGSGPLTHDDVDTLVGYAVWPKFGFEADVLAVELDRFPDRALHHATTIQDIRQAVSGWWEAHGSARTMSFDLKAGSRSWTILINYLYNALQEDAP